MAKIFSADSSGAGVFGPPKMFNLITRQALICNFKVRCEVDVLEKIVVRVSLPWALIAPMSEMMLNTMSAMALH